MSHNYNRPERAVEAYQITPESGPERVQKILGAPYLIPKVNATSDYFYDPSVVAELFDDRVQRWVPLREGDWVVRERFNHFVKYPPDIFDVTFDTIEV